MADTRSLKEKLEAMAAQSVSPHEAEVARSLLEKLQSSAPKTETPRLLTRDDILGAPDRPGAGYQRTVTVGYRGMTFTLNEDEFAVIFGGMDRVNTTVLGGTPSYVILNRTDRPRRPGGSGGR